MTLVDENGQPTTPPSRKKIFIVIEENESGNGEFSVFMGGDIHRIGKVHDKDLTAAEFWGHVIFGIAIETLKKAGVIK